ncbi:uncharacterized protein LOC118185877 [Stegodyphus dumicola]|uniref:uncharacterized protein LOC118185877 n=1 Tax=Stegodyphus dumicola TaxID=202533 RepID=UPI0015B0986D|nr:uncharacterized protein LOC118185877 [Stegodyphus dumicola]
MDYAFIKFDFIRVCCWDQMQNYTILMQNQTNNSAKTQGNLVKTHPPKSQASFNASQKSDKQSKRSSLDEKTEISVYDYCPTSFPVPSSPKRKDVFDSSLAADQRNSYKRTHESASKAEKLKIHSEYKLASETLAKRHKHDRGYSKLPHSMRMQVADKNKESSRKEQKLSYKKELTKLNDSQLKVPDELPSFGVEMPVKEKFLKKLNRQERVVEEEKLPQKPLSHSPDFNKKFILQIDVSDSDMVLGGLDNFVLPYIDDIAVFSPTWDRHMKDLDVVLGRLQEAKLTVKPSKCKFAQDHVKFLGHEEGFGKRSPSEAKIQAIRDFPIPTTKTQIRSYLGTVGYYARYIKDYARIAAPLTDALKGKNKKEKVIWTKRVRRGFQ